MAYDPNTSEIGVRLLERQKAQALLQGEAHSNVREGLQRALTSEHVSGGYDSDSYDDYPYVADVFGDHKAGTVVYRHQGGHYKAPYTKDTDNQEESGSGASYTLGEPSMVEPAYVDSATDMKEAYEGAELNDNQIRLLERYISMRTRKQMDKSDFAGKGTSFPIRNAGDVRAALDSVGRAGSGNDSKDIIKSRIIEIAKRKGFALPKSERTKESGTDDILIGEIVDIREAFLDKDGNGRLVLITAGLGSDGNYSPEVLKQAAEDKVFHEGLHMHIDHQTDKEAAERPEQSMRTLAAKLSGDAEYVESGPLGPRLEASVKAYPEYVDFLNARGGDTGVSINARGRKNGTIQHNGRTVANVERLVVAKSSDFVTRAGRGGKLLQLFESFRESHRVEERESDSMAKVEIEDKDLAALRESAAKVPQLTLAVDRTNERLNRYDARDFVMDRLKESGIPTAAQNRLAKSILAPEATIPVKESGAIDFDKLKEVVKVAVEGEIAYLKEAGLGFKVVKMPGADSTPEESDDSKALKESAKTMDDEIASLIAKTTSNIKKGAA